MRIDANIATFILSIQERIAENQDWLLRKTAHPKSFSFVVLRCTWPCNSFTSAVYLSSLVSKTLMQKMSMISSQEEYWKTSHE